jgi:hypothetical protein
MACHDKVRRHLPPAKEVNMGSNLTERIEKGTVDLIDVQLLKKDRDFWHREAIKQAAELGEMKIKIGYLIESNLSHGGCV